MEDLTRITAALEAVTTVREPAEVELLHDAADRFFEHPDAAGHIDIWFRLFERFPEDEGAGVFWTILQALENVEGFEVRVIASVKRKPSRFPVRMINRMLNANPPRADAAALLGLLEAVAADERCGPGVRGDAQRCVEYQRMRR
jgi:hypothetical protein